jgi:IS30 family transposase
MEPVSDRVVSLPRESGSVEERMLKGDLVREMVARKERGAGIKRIARELGVDRKTVRRWLKVGGCRPARDRRDQVVSWSSEKAGRSYSTGTGQRKRSGMNAS